MKLINCLKAIRYFLAVQTEKYVFQTQWRKKNSHNYTKVDDYIFPIEIVSVGNNTYGTINAISYGNKDEQLSIGNYCSIAGNVFFLLSGEHDYHRLSTYPFDRKILNGDVESICRGPIVIDDDVWIGFGCIILSGVHIGRGAVIGAGSVVTKDVPPYAIFAGNRIIKYRFSDKIIDSINRIDYGSISNEFVANNIELLHETLTEENVASIIESLIK